LPDWHGIDHSQRSAYRAGSIIAAGTLIPEKTIVDPVRYGWVHRENFAADWTRKTGNNSALRKIIWDIKTHT
jgi:hypothetical protein